MLAELFTVEYLTTFLMLPLFEKSELERARKRLQDYEYQIK